MACYLSISKSYPGDHVLVEVYTNRNTTGTHQCRLRLVIWRHVSNERENCSIQRGHKDMLTLRQKHEQT